MRKIIRCAACGREMRVVGSTGLGKEVEKIARCPNCETKIKVQWPRGDKFNVQRVATP